MRAAPRLGGAGPGRAGPRHRRGARTRSGRATGSRSWAITSTTTPARSSTSGSAPPRASPGWGPSCGRVRCCGRRCGPGGSGSARRRRCCRSRWARPRRSGSSAPRADGPGAGGGGPRGAGAAGRGRGGVARAAHASAAGRAAGRRRGARRRPAGMLPGSTRIEQLEALAQEYLGEFSTDGDSDETRPLGPGFRARGLGHRCAARAREARRPERWAELPPVPELAAPDVPVRRDLDGAGDGRASPRARRAFGRGGIASSASAGTR